MVNLDRCGLENDMPHVHMQDVERKQMHKRDIDGHIPEDVKSFSRTNRTNLVKFV